MARARLLLLAASPFVFLLAACTPEKTESDSKQKRVDDVAMALERYVHRYYETNLAEEKHQPGPSTASRLKAREELREALRALGLDMPEGNNLKGALAAARDVLVAHDYVFLPVNQGGDDQNDELGISFAHVRRREEACSMELWGRKVEYKLLVYEPLVYEYPIWRAQKTKGPGPMYQPGRFSVARETIYIDHDYCVKRAQDQPPETQALGLDGIEKEVELRQAAGLLFSRALADPSDVKSLEERILWTALRYGDPDLAWRDVNGLAADARFPAAFRAAAESVRARLPRSLDDLNSKAARSAALRSIAEEAWKRLGSDGLRPSTQGG